MWSICNCWDLCSCLARIIPSARTPAGPIHVCAFWSVRQARLESLDICASRCGRIVEYNWCAVSDTHSRRALWTSGTWIPPRSGSPQNNSPWSMECLCVRAAGSHEDRTSVDSPVVISSFVSQLELEGIGRVTTRSRVANKHVCFFDDDFFFSCRWRCRKLWRSKQCCGRHTWASEPPRPKCFLTTELGDELPGGGYLPAGKYQVYCVECTWNRVQLLHGHELVSIAPLVLPCKTFCAFCGSHLHHMISWIEDGGKKYSYVFF